MSVTAQIEGDFIEAAAALLTHFKHSPEFYRSGTIETQG